MGTSVGYLLNVFLVMLINMEKTSLLWQHQLLSVVAGLCIVENKQSNKDAYFSLSLLLAVDVTF